MSDYKYSSEFERELTQKYEGIYTSEEVELNKKLYEECSKETIDYAAVEELLKKGADPLGGTSAYGWDLLEHVYEELVYSSQDSDSSTLPKLTELFLQYGMDVDHPRLPYDDSYSISPLWSFAFVPNEYATEALKMLLDHGLSAESFSDFWQHAIGDLCYVDGGDLENDESWNQECTWIFKMFLLGASYDHIYQNDEEIPKVVCSSINTGDIHMFRNWNDFEYRFDASHCERHFYLNGAILHIYSKQTSEEVWTIGVGRAGRKALADAYSNR
jgi:hypothetical protein